MISSNKKKVRYKDRYGNWTVKISLLISLCFQRNRKQDHQLRGDSIGDLRTEKTEIIFYATGRLNEPGKQHDC